MILNQFEQLKDQIFLGKYTFNEFVTGSSNIDAYEHAKRVAKDILCASTPLVIVADKGLGKTHLLASVGNAIISRCLDLTVCYYTAEMFVDEFQNFLRIDKENIFLESFSRVDVLLFDDLDHLVRRDQEQKELLGIFDQMQASGKKIVVTASEHPKKIKGQNRKLLSFLKKGNIVDFVPADIETRLAKTRMQFEVNGVEYYDEALHCIVSQVGLNSRELEAFVGSISSYSRLKSLPVDIDVVNELILNFKAQYLLTLYPSSSIQCSGVGE